MLPSEVKKYSAKVCRKFEDDVERFMQTHENVERLNQDIEGIRIVEGGKELRYTAGEHAFKAPECEVEFDSACNAAVDHSWTFECKLDKSMSCRDGLERVHHSWVCSL